MEEDKLSIITRLMSELKSMDIDIQVTFYSDLSGNVKQGFFEPKNIGSFIGFDDLIYVLASYIKRRESRIKYTENILTRFKDKFIK